MDFCDVRDILDHTDLLPRCAQPRRVNLKVRGQVFGSSRFGDFNAIPDRSPDVPPAALVKLLEYFIGTGSKIEDNVTAYLASAESAAGKSGQWSPVPAVSRDQLGLS